MTHDLTEPLQPEAVAHEEPEPDTRARLRAFEDAHIGAHLPRPHGEIERGIGSAFAGLPAVQKAHHAALEKLIKAEHDHAQAQAAEAVAQARLEAARRHADETEKAAEAPEPPPAADIPAPASASASGPLPPLEPLPAPKEAPAAEVVHG